MLNVHFIFKKLSAWSLHFKELKFVYKVFRNVWIQYSNIYFLLTHEILFNFKNFLFNTFRTWWLQVLITLNILLRHYFHSTLIIFEFGYYVFIILIINSFSPHYEAVKKILLPGCHHLNLSCSPMWRCQ